MPSMGKRMASPFNVHAELALMDDKGNTHLLFADSPANAKGILPVLYSSAAAAGGRLRGGRLLCDRDSINYETPQTKNALCNAFKAFLIVRY
jgi:hypothetical protein